jgi:hypothetical protein
MKKLFIIVVLSFSVILAFSQEYEHAKFQGVWYAMIEGEKVIYVFIDDICITMRVDLGIVGIACRYSVENNNLILSNPREPSFDGWKDNHDGSEELEFQYVFSGDRLIFVSDGEELVTFSRDNTDFPEW